MEPNEYIDPQYAEPVLDEKEIALRQAFVVEYMKCRNAFTACVTLGFMIPYAPDWAKQFMGEGYVRRLIAAADRIEDSEELTKERQFKYRSWMESEATYTGPGSSHGSRVSAIAHLMKIEGMEAPIKIEGTGDFKGGVMVVPALSSPDEWSSQASDQQAELKATVQD